MSFLAKKNIRWISVLMLFILTVIAIRCSNKGEVVVIEDFSKLLTYDVPPAKRFRKYLRTGSVSVKVKGYVSDTVMVKSGLVLPLKVVGKVDSSTTFIYYGEIGDVSVFTFKPNVKGKLELEYKDHTLF